MHLEDKVFIDFLKEYSATRAQIIDFFSKNSNVLDRQDYIKSLNLEINKNYGIPVFVSSMKRLIESGAFDDDVTVPRNDVVVDKRPIELITTEINFYKVQGAQAIIEIGKRLKEAKEQLQHGEWLKWLENEVEFTDRTAQNFIRIAEEFTNTKALSYLGYTKCLNLLALEPNEREEFVNTTHNVNGLHKTVEEMSTREMQELIKELKEAKAELNDKKQWAENLQSELERVKKQASESEFHYETVSTSYKHLQDTNSQHYKNLCEAKEKITELENRPVEVAVQEPDGETLERIREEGAIAEREKFNSLVTSEISRRKQATEEARLLAKENERLNSELQQLKANTVPQFNEILCNCNELSNLWEAIINELPDGEVLDEAQQVLFNFCPTCGKEFE